MKEDKSAQRKRLWFAVLAMVVTSYAATWFFGVRSVKNAHKAELSRFYEKQKLFYDGNKADLAENVFWKPMLARYDGFPSWDEYRLWVAVERHDRYYAIFPLVILSLREHKSLVPGNGAGTYEYHLWYIVGSRLIKKQLRWIE